MQYIRHNYNNYPVSNEIYHLVETKSRKYRHIEPWKVREYAVKLLESDNYLEGKIPYHTLLMALSNLTYMKNWLSLLTSKTYSQCLISHDLAEKLVCRRNFINWTSIDEKVKKGIIKEEYLTSIFEMTSEHEKYNDTVEEMTTIIFKVLTSEKYEKELISKEVVEIILNETKFNEKTEFEHRININCMYYILTSKELPEEEKEKYILAVKRLNKDKINEMYKLQLAKKQVKTIKEFAENLVKYILSIPQNDLNQGYVRKRKQETN